MCKLLTVCIVVVITAVGWGRVPTQAEVTEVAQDIVTRDSFQGIMPDRTVESVTWVELEDSYGVWAVTLAPSGHLVLGTSTKYRAMISWGNEAFAIPDRASPQYALLLRAAQRAAAAEAGDGEEHPSWEISGGASLLATAVVLPESAIVHQPVDTTTWAQSGVMAWYVPGKAPCGCVATATAQIMRALEWPVYAEGFFEADLNYTTSAGTTSTDTYAFSPYSKFDYSIMHDVLADYQSNLLNNHQVARLVLLNDILARMNFADGGSGAVASWAAVTPWTTGADCRKLNTNKTVYTADDIAAIKKVMEDKVPIVCTIPGHAIVGSGYALYENEPYVRMNYGWGSSGNGWYHITDSEEYIIVYPMRTVQCDPLPAVSSATPELSWHLPTCYEGKVESFTVTATKIPESTAKGNFWSDSFSTYSGTIIGNQDLLRVQSNQLQAYMSASIDGAPKALYTWDPIFVPTDEAMWTFYYTYSNARGPVHLQVLPLGGAWETVMEIDPGWNATNGTAQYAEIDLAKYAGQPIKLRLYVNPTVYTNSYYYNVVNFSMMSMNVSGLSQVITESTATTTSFTVDGAAESYTIPSGELTAGTRYAFTVTPNFTDTTLQTFESMPCYTQIVDDTTAVEPTTTITCTSTSAEAYNLSSMLFVDNMRRYCTYSGYSLIHVETSPAATALELHSSHPTAYPDEAFRIEELGNGAFDIIIDSNRMPQSPRVNDCLNLSVIAVSETGTRTAQELSLIFTDSTFAVSETIPTYGGDYPTELYAEVNDGEQTLDSLVWTDVEGTEYAKSEIEWFYVSSVNIILNGGSLTLDGSRTLSGMLQIYPEARVKLTTAAALGNLTVMGSGTLECAGVFPTKRGGLTDTTWWRGTVDLTGDIKLEDAATSLEVLGHSKSKLLVTGNVSGYLAKNTDCNIPLELNGSITLTDGYGETSYTFAKLSGSGSFGNDRNKNSEITYTIVFSDASDFTGSLTINSRNTATRFVIGKDDALAGAIVVSADATAVVANEKTWSAPNGVTVEGTLGGSGTIDAALTFASGSKLDATQGTLTVTGAVSATNIPVVVDENCYGRILTAVNLAADAFTLTKTTALLLVDANGLIYTTRPTLPVGGTETVSDAAATRIAQAAIASGVYNFTLDPTSAHPDGAELFNNVISVDPDSDVVKIDYDFGIQSMTVQNLANGMYLVLTAAVKCDGASASYAEGTQVKVLLNGSELSSVEVIDTATSGEIKLAVPLSVIEEETARTNTQSVNFNVKAVK